MIREFKHATTGRTIRVSDGSRTARLVEADDNYTEIKAKSTKKEAASDGSSNRGGRRGGSRKKSDGGGK